VLAWDKSASRRARGGGVRMSRAVEDQSATFPEKMTSELGRIICSLARRLKSKPPHALACLIG
jgi:hypothetical protein